MPSTTLPASSTTLINGGSSSSRNPVIASYQIREQLAMGGQATVYRARNSQGKLAAIKVIQCDQATDQGKQKMTLLKREMRIHETLKHTNVLELMGGEARARDGQWPAGLYLLLALADAGDLFDKITPDIGLEEDVAHLFFTQLVGGLSYLGKSGICHRDVKPENCLLDGQGNLKISDFGLATVFKYKGQERKLRERCGSPPYAAPELAISEPYAGEPIDVWSAGVVLFALLVGNTPWDEPTTRSPEFSAYLDGTIWNVEPWNRLRESSACSLLLKMLHPDPGKRCTLAQVSRHDWFAQDNPLVGPNGQCSNGAMLFARMANSLHQHGYLGPPQAIYEEVMREPTAAHFTQRGLDPNASFVSSLQLYSKLSMAPTQRTNPGLTRFFTTLPPDEFLLHLVAALERLEIQHRVLPAPEVAGTPFLARVKIRGTDKRGLPIEGSITLNASTLPSTDAMDLDGQNDTAGLDVVMWKKKADPLELKVLWRTIMRALPFGVVHAT